MEDRVEKLLGILNKYTVEEISRLYRNHKVKEQTEYFTKYPEVRWSEAMKKNMIQAAKRKRITLSRMKYIQAQINELNNYNDLEHVSLAVKDLNHFFEALKERVTNLANVVLLHVEFSDFQTEACIEGYGPYKQKWYENPVFRMNSKFKCAEYWKEIDSTKFSYVYEQLEGLDLEDEEYPGIFVEIRELRVFNAIKQALHDPAILSFIDDHMPKAKIEVGMHDDRFFTLRDFR